MHHLHIFAWNHVVITMTYNTRLRGHEVEEQPDELGVGGVSEERGVDQHGVGGGHQQLPGLHCHVRGQLQLLQRGLHLSPGHGHRGHLDTVLSCVIIPLYHSAGFLCKTSSNIATCQEAGHLEIGGDGDEDGHGEAEHRGVGAAVAVTLHLLTVTAYWGTLLAATDRLQVPGASEEDEHEGGEGEGGPLQGDQVEERGGEHGGHPAYTPGLDSRYLAIL